MSLGRLDHYEVLRFVGRGGMSDVYLAHDTHLDCDVALKVVREEHAADPAHRARLLGEARSLAKLDHPNIVGILGCGEATPDPPDFLWRDQGTPRPERVVYLAMRYLEGTDLATEIERRPLPIATVLDWAKQIARGLEAAHAHGIVHRDLKPGNICVTPEKILKIVDFGLSSSQRTTVDSLQRTDSISSEYLVGTIGYLCPDQVGPAGKADPRCDLFSLGVILYEMITGRRPFTGDTPVDVLREIATSEPPPLARYARDVPEALQHILDKLLRKDPQRRYQTAREVLTDLEDIALPRPRPVPRPHGLWQELWRRRGQVAIAAVSVVGLLALADPVARWLRRTETVVVPAFANATGDPALDKTVTGLGMDLLTSLARCPINVVGSPLRDDKGEPERDPAVLGRAFGAQSVLLGTVHAHAAGAAGHGVGLSLHVRLVRVRNGADAWSHAWDAGFDQVARLRDQMLRAVPGHWRQRTGPDAAADREPSPRPAAAVQRYLSGLGYLDSSDPAVRDTALREFDAALAWDPGFARALAGRARTLLAFHLYSTDTAMLARAERDARQAIRLEPDELDGHRALGRILRERGRAREAIAALEEVTRRNEHDAEALGLIGAAYRQLGEMDRARRYFREGLDAQPGSPKLWRSYGIFLLMSVADFPAAEQAFRMEIALRPGDNRGYEDLAAVFSEQCRYAEALATYAKLPNPKAGSLDLHNNRGTAYYFSGHYGLALRDYLEAVSQRPDDGNWRMNLGDCYSHLGRLQEALLEYGKARVLLEQELLATPDDLQKRSAFAMGLAKCGQVARAREEIDRCYQANPVGDVTAMHNLAKALAICGDEQRALGAIEVLVAAHDFSKCRLRDDDEFRSLRADARFRRLVGLPKG